MMGLPFHKEVPPWKSNAVFSPPTTFHYSYAADSVAPREPRPPVPYETFSDTFSY